MIQTLCKQHLTWLATLGEFIVLPSVKERRKKADRERWLYKKFNPNFKLREILPQEIVIEFDGYDGHTRLDAVQLAKDTVSRLAHENFSFIVFDHGGKSPHIHLYVEGLEALSYDERCKYKETFIRNMVPNPSKADLSLAKDHLIALEYAPHWKYGTIKEEVLCRMNLAKLSAPMITVCRRCYHKVECDFVDCRGFFYCKICAAMGNNGELVL